MPAGVFALLQLFDGQRTLRDIQAEIMRQSGGELPPLDSLTDIVQTMEEGLLLDGPHFQERLASPVREPACLGCYEAEPSALRRQLDDIFLSPGGPGMPGTPEKVEGFRGVLVPHIDYQKGGPGFAWGFKEVFEKTAASLFVIIATSHYSGLRYMLTRKDFKTPLGIVPTDQQYIDRLVALYGNGLFDDPYAHLPEHSIELEVVFLQYLYEGRRPIRIVPLLVGPFQDCVDDGSSPDQKADVAKMARALERLDRESTEPICYIISGDLAHIGPKFGDPDPILEPALSQSRQEDQALLRHAEAADPSAYFQFVAAENDRRRICGFPPTYTFLEAIHPGCGRMLYYDQYAHPRGHESVSFATVAFDS